MRIRSHLVLGSCTVLLLGVGVGPAAAGSGVDNAKGQTERGPANSNSICSFSGLNDDPLDPVEGGRVQSYGQLVKAGLKASEPSPSLLCNGHKFPYPEGFGPPLP